MSEDLNTRHKRLKFQCWHRGFREMDLILGNFCDNHLTSLDAQELDDFETLLDLPDHDVYQWLIGNAEVPDAFNTGVFARLRKLDYIVDESASGLARIKS